MDPRRNSSPEPVLRWNPDPESSLSNKRNSNPNYEKFTKIVTQKMLPCFLYFYILNLLLFF